MIRTKYSRTPHLPFSPGATDDDRMLRDCFCFESKEIVITEKLDGECTTVYSDGYTHARSLDSASHPSRSWIKQYASQWAHELEPGFRVCGENLYAFHSILYTQLPTYFFVFGIYDSDNRCLSWSETEDWCSLLGLHTVPVRYRGPWRQDLVLSQWNGQGAFPTFGSKEQFPKWPTDFEPCKAEGYVVRTEAAFAYKEFGLSVAKWVRKEHVQTDSHWMEREPILNLLADA